MRTILFLAGAASIALSAPALAQGNSGGGGNGGPKAQGGGKHTEAKANPARGGGADRGKVQKQEERQGGNGKDRADAPRAMAEQGNRNGAGKSKTDRGPDVVKAARDDVKVARDDVKVARGDKGDRKITRAGGDAWRDTSRLYVDRSWDGSRYRYDDRAYLVPTTSWCPPGLAKKGNGCMPPGQARKLDRYDGWSSWYPVRYRDDGYDWRYDGGYLYRIGDGGLVSALIPLIGGALFGGQVWPAQYTGYEAPAYYDRFYGYDDGYDYRIAQNAIFAVDPQSSEIEAIAGLLTGDRWGVGQRMPLGYDAYNVPWDYRDRYADGPDAMYRYSDGYVYEVDPTTQLVRAVIELLV